MQKALNPKAIKATVQDGRTKGKFGADVQVRLESLSAASRLTQNGAKERLVKILQDSNADELEKQILSILSNPENATAVDYAKLNAEIIALKTRGKTINDSIKLQRSEYYSGLTSALDGYIDSGNSVLSQKQAGVLKKVKQGFATYTRWAIGSYNDYIDTIVPPALRADFRVGEEISQQKRIVRTMTQKMTDTAREIYGGNIKELEYVLEGSHKTEDLGVFVDMNGDNQRIEMSTAQARKLYMEYQDPSLRDNTIHNKDGNALTKEMVNEIFSRLLTNKDKAFANAQLKIYSEFYNQINEVYRDVYGVDLPKTEFYSPIARDAGEELLNGLDEFNAEVAFRVEVATGTATKLRDSKATSALKKQSDIAVFNRHVMEMSRFVALGRKTRTLSNVFKDPRLRKKIRAKYGDGFDKDFHSLLEILAKGSPVDEGRIDKVFNYYNRNFSTAVLGLKPKIGVTQLSSYFSYAENMPTKDLLSGTRDFFLEMDLAIKTLSKSELLLDRGASPDVDIAKMGQAISSTQLRKIQKGNENLIDYALIFTKMGDRATIYVGGWAVYKSAIKNGKTPEQAMAEFERVTARTQQSKDLDQISLMQTSSAVGRSLGMFQSAPFAQFRGEARAIRQLAKGEIDFREFGKLMAIYHVLIPQMYKLLSNGLVFGEFDWEDQAWTLAFGSLNAIPLVSELVNIMARSAQGKTVGSGGILKSMNNVGFVAKEIGAGFTEALTEGDIGPALDVLPDLLSTAAILRGLPSPQVEQGIEGIMDIDEGNVREGAMKLFGYPDSIAEANENQGGTLGITF